MKTREYRHLSDEEKEVFKAGVLICACKRDMFDWNDERTKDNKEPTTVIQSHNRPPPAARCDSVKARGLHRNIKLCRGVRVMLTQNINVSLGLTNGSLGTVVGIVYLNDTDPFPEVLVQWDNYRGASLLERMPRVYPIGAVEVNWTDRGQLMVRRMIPLMVAYAITIHKSQVYIQIFYLLL